MNGSFKLAITIDDFPTHGDIAQPYDRNTIVRDIIECLKKHQVPPVIGFSTTHSILENIANCSVLKEWEKSNNFISNHTHSHFDLQTVPHEEFIHDIKRNEKVLDRYRNYKRFFRYPFLSEGDNYEKREKVKKFLSRNFYRVAPVTIDFWDFLWNPAVSKCVAHKEEIGLCYLREIYVAVAKRTAEMAVSISKKLFGRNIYHILVLHLGIATSLFLDDTLSTYRRLGCEFITLEEALSDDVYEVDFFDIKWNGYNFLQQAALSKGVDISRFPEVPERKILRYMYNLPSTIVCS